MTKKFTQKLGVRRNGRARGIRRKIAPYGRELHVRGLRGG